MWFFAKSEVNISVHLKKVEDYQIVYWKTVVMYKIHYLCSANIIIQSHTVEMNLSKNPTKDLASITINAIIFDECMHSGQ